jgi:TIR domain
MRPPAEQVVRDYLNRLSVAARNRLPPEDRRAFLARTRDYIERQSGVRDMTDPADVMRALNDYGEPEALVERERARRSERERAAAAGKASFWKPRPRGGAPGRDGTTDGAGASGTGPSIENLTRPDGRPVAGEIKEPVSRPISPRWRPGAPARPVPEPGAEATARVFLSYRRDETRWAAELLFDRLSHRFGKDQIFKDIYSIQLGDDFVEAITSAVGSCDVLLALIGDRWLTITDPDGQRRLDNDNDFVRLEIDAALTRNIRVIPILIEGAHMPRASELPASMAKLVRRQALTLNPDQEFESGIARLLNALGRALDELHKTQGTSNS